jgi:hypothetical protein
VVKRFAGDGRVLTPWQRVDYGASAVNEKDAAGYETATIWQVDDTFVLFSTTMLGFVDSKAAQVQ